MLSVKFQAPIVVDEKNLSALLALAGVSAVVEPYLNGAAKPGRKPRVAAEPAPAPAAEPQASAETPASVKPAGKKRGRKSNAEKAAEAAAAGGAPAQDPAAKPSADGEALVARFSVLIDTNFSAAKELLDGYGVERFSEIKADHYADFDAKLTALGV